MKIGGGKINLVIGIVLAVIAIAGLSYGLYHHFTVGPEDHGLMEREGVTLKPKVLPQAVFTDSPVVLKHLHWAVEWWNAKTDKRTLFVVGGMVEPGTWDRSKRDKIGLVFMEVASIDAKSGAHAVPVYDKKTGEIWYTRIVLNYDYAYSEKTLKTSMIHEMGHSLGLEDDPHSLDRGGIMDQKAAIIGISDPTKQDISILGGL